MWIFEPRRSPRRGFVLQSFDVTADLVGLVIGEPQVGLLVEVLVVRIGHAALPPTGPNSLSATSSGSSRIRRGPTRTASMRPAEIHRRTVRGSTPYCSAISCTECEYLRARRLAQFSVRGVEAAGIAVAFDTGHPFKG